MKRLSLITQFKIEFLLSVVEKCLENVCLFRVYFVSVDHFMAIEFKCHIEDLFLTTGSQKSLILIRLTFKR